MSETRWAPRVLCLCALVAAMRGSARGRLILLGTIYYVFYDNMYYLFSAYNRFFLVYVALCILSSGALVTILLGTRAGSIGGSERDAARKVVAVVLFVIAGVLAVMWIGQAVLFIATGRVPQLITDSGGSTDMVGICDLTLIVPPMVLAGIWLWQARPWGRVLATAMLVQGTIITVNLIVTPLFQAAAGVKNVWVMVPLLAVMGAAFLLSALYMLGNVRGEVGGEAQR